MSDHGIVRCSDCGEQVFAVGKGPRHECKALPLATSRDFFDRYLDWLGEEFTVKGFCRLFVSIFGAALLIAAAILAVWWSAEVATGPMLAVLAVVLVVFLRWVFT